MASKGGKSDEKALVTVFVFALLLLVSWIATIPLGHFMATGCEDYSFVKTSLWVVFGGGFFGACFLICITERRERKKHL